MTSARRPPECLSAAMRALSWPVVARNTVTLTPGSSLAKPFSTAVTVSCVTDVYKVSLGAALAAEPAAAEDEEDPQPVTPRAAASRNGTAGEFFASGAGPGSRRDRRSGSGRDQVLPRRTGGKAAQLGPCLVPAGHIGQRVDGVVREVVDRHQRDQPLDRSSFQMTRNFTPVLLYCAASEVPALARSTSNSTTTSSLSLSAPKKPLYGLIPKADCGTVTEPRYRPSPGEFTCSRTGCVWPLKVSEPSTAPPLAPKRTARDEVKLAEPSPRIPLMVFLMSLRSPSLSGLAPPVPSRTSSEPRSRSAVTLAAVTPPASSSGTSTCADHRVNSMVRSWPALAASPARLVLITTRPVSGPSRKLPVFAVTGPP